MKTKYLALLSLIPALAQAAGYEPLLNCAALIQDKSTGSGRMIERARKPSKESREYLLQLPNNEGFILYQTLTSYQIPISKDLTPHRTTGVEEMRIATKIPVAGNPRQLENMIAVMMKKENGVYKTQEVGPVASEEQFKKSLYDLNLVRSQTQMDDSTRSALIKSLSERVGTMQSEFEQQKRDFQKRAKENPQGVKGNTVSWPIELGSITIKNPSFDEYKTAVDTCHKAGVTISESVSQYFSSSGGTPTTAKTRKAH